MRRLTQEQLEKELQAQRARAQARAYLQKHGVGPGEREAAYDVQELELSC